MIWGDFRFPVAALKPLLGNDLKEVLRKKLLKNLSGISVEEALKRPLTLVIPAQAGIQPLPGC
ncbi:hypothetical protein [Pseudoxanthomonas dokdonensis]|uniref:Uncharacterized protein n=1 Tax=Pseudoxanthomonas dokdonensis TaxID=344882 RepID=A0A0R0CIK3_9GAMM|nr:hypothetical protein [Pseudoxanthomonas dokdonensis]KRG69663.1 hypothetical protein ABB29_09355 [Pseudoxanthomonas dokdonensis]